MAKYFVLLRDGCPSGFNNPAAKEFAEKRTKIAQSYVEGSQLQAQMPDGVDSYHGYGMFVAEVRPDFTAGWRS